MTPLAAKTIYIAEAERQIKEYGDTMEVEEESASSPNRKRQHDGQSESSCEPPASSTDSQVEKSPTNSVTNVEEELVTEQTSPIQEPNNNPKWSVDGGTIADKRTHTSLPVTNGTTQQTQRCKAECSFPTSPTKENQGSFPDTT